MMNEYFSIKEENLKKLKEVSNTLKDKSKSKRISNKMFEVIDIDIEDMNPDEIIIKDDLKYLI